MSWEELLWAEKVPVINQKQNAFSGPVCSWTLVSESQMSSWVAATVQQLCQSDTDFPSKTHGTPIDCAPESHLHLNKPKEDRFCIRHFQSASYGIETQLGVGRKSSWVCAVCLHLRHSCAF